MVISQSVEPGVEAVGRGVGVIGTGAVGTGCGGVGIRGRVGVTRLVGVRVGVGHCASAGEEHSVSQDTSHSEVARAMLRRRPKGNPSDRLTHTLTIPAAITA